MIKATVLIPVFAAALMAQTSPLAHWRFDSQAAPLSKVAETRDDAGQVADSLRGNAWVNAGVAGAGLQFDGITAHIVRSAARVPKLGPAFTLEAWIAPAAYPFNWAPILQQQSGAEDGFFLGIGDAGQIGFRFSAGGKWNTLETKTRLQLRQWAHVAAVFGRGAAEVYINGELAASAPMSGEFVPSPGADLWIARNKFQLEQTQPVSRNRQHLTNILFDGIVDELQVWPAAKAAAEIRAAYQKLRPSSLPAIEARVLPAGRPGAGRFGAEYSQLKYYKGWDDTWRVGDYPDVVVRFDQAPYRFVFWRGMSYIPHWVTENGIWYDNEFVESFQPGLQGSAEPMSDKTCRFSNVRIIESSDARVVIHWRYAPVDVGYRFAFFDETRGWGDWTDEVHTIYPDGVGVRDITVHTSISDPKFQPPQSGSPVKAHEWHESIVVMGPGMSPGEAIEPGAVTLITNDGAAKTYSWEHQVPPKNPKEPVGANSHLINTRSKFKPFAIARPQDNPVFDVYAGEIRREVSIFPWWNHWPTAFEPSNGRYALAADRASHSSLTHMRWDEYEKGPNRLKKFMLEGLTDGTAADVAALSRSWSNAPKVSAGGVYDPKQRAYVFERSSAAGKAALAFRVEASHESPVRNLALVVKNWGGQDAALVLNGKAVPQGPLFRVGRRAMVEEADLVVWIRVDAERPVEVSLQPISPINRQQRRQ